MVPESGKPGFPDRDHAPHAPARICVARVGAAHGVRGEVRLWPFTEDPMRLRDYAPLETADGATAFDITSLRAARDHLVARFAGVTTRDAAERLTGLELYVPRARLPAPDEGEFYHTDLIGLAAVSADGEALGRVVAVHNFGAGDIIELAPPSGGATMLLPFSDAVVPTVDLAGGRIVVKLPESAPE
ncbi:MAG: ribosome maturation factor RimM [Xanthobacteraceae bacterium]|nr:MAG: ribosome maturation factor RimM [Xanthobacteraceae bacterium]